MYRKQSILLAIIFIQSITFLFSQAPSVTISGIVKTTNDDSTFLSGTVTDETGRFSLTNAKPGSYRSSIIAE